jgi:hypothetical protein
MSGRDVEREVSDFFRNTAPPEPSTRLRASVAAARLERTGRLAGRGRIGALRAPRMALSIVGLAASIILAGGLVLALANRDRYGIAGSSPTPSATESATAGPTDNPSASPAESPSQAATAGPSASPSSVVAPSPTRDPAFTFGPVGKFQATGTTAGNPTMSALLPDGRVLLVGSSAFGNSAGLYSPVTGEYTAISPASGYHWRGTMTRLEDGRALLVGGFGATDPLATAEVYEPASGEFASTGSLATARYDFSASMLRNGEVLVVGGSSWTDAQPATVYLKSAELYDPATGKFRSAGNMTVARTKPAIVTLQDGPVLIAGGMGGSHYPSLSSAEIYDPATGKFSATGDMTTGRAVGVPTLLQDGRVLVTGGDDDMMGVQYADLYDPSTGTWTKTGPEAIDRFSHTATLLVDGRVLIAGGYAGPGGVASIDPSIFAMTESRYLSAAEIYDPIAGTFTRIGNMSAVRIDATATLLNDGRVLIAGGELPGSNHRADLYVP